MEIAEYSKKIRAMREKKVVVRPIKRKGGWVAEDHDSAFLNTGSARDYTVPSKARGKVLVNPLPDFETNDIKLLAEELGLEHVRELNPNTPKPHNFWKREAESTVRLDKNGKHLILKEVRDFIEFLVLRSNTHLIALTWSNRFDNGEFLFALVEEGEEMIDQVSNLEEKKQAYAYLGKIDKSATHMTDFLFVYYLTKRDAKRPPRNATVNWLKNEIGKIIDTDLSVYLEILDDKDYNLKLLIQRAVETGALLKDRHNYSLPGSDSPIGVLEDLIYFLDDPQNQTVRMKLMNHVEEKIET